MKFDKKRIEEFLIIIAKGFYVLINQKHYIWNNFKFPNFFASKEYYIQKNPSLLKNFNDFYKLDYIGCWDNYFEYWTGNMNEKFIFAFKIYNNFYGYMFIEGS